MDAIRELEDWRNSNKAHAVSITIDNQYGAACWIVTLYKGRQKVTVHEVAFYEGPGRVEQCGNLWLWCSGNDEFQGLAETVIFAIAAAREFFCSD